ncbi:MAG: CRISPR-associated endonuclease Cas1 [Bacteroidetes bacterium]|nr:CRISPR-associated endonuclease Cas1 [Bacteroidota bacterium]
MTLDPTAEDVRTIAMGYEGHAASIYWQAIKGLLPSEFEFVGRITRGAKDAINQCFNYVYGLLYGEVWRAIVKAGLDPYFGLIHGSKRDQGSLIFDLIEEFRSPFADRIVVSMFGRRFHPDINKEGLLKTASKKSLAKCFSKRWHGKIRWRSMMLSPAQILERQAQTLSKVFCREARYYPFKMSW